MDAQTLAILGYAAAVLMGATLGLIGGGGSILTVPILVYLLGVDPVAASGYSLFTVGMTALVGGFGYVRRGLVDWAAVGLFGVPSLAGVYLVRAYGVPALPDSFTLAGFDVAKGQLIMLVFATLMAAASLSMILADRLPAGKKRAAAPGDPGRGHPGRGETASGDTAGGDRARADAPPRFRLAKLPVLALEGLVVGGVTGFVGAGGGFLVVPALIFLLGLPVRTAIGTSLFVIALKSLLGFSGELQSAAALDWPLLLAFSGLAVGGILGGVEVNRRLPAEGLKPLFGWFVLAMAAVILFQELSGPAGV